MRGTLLFLRVDQAARKILILFCSHAEALFALSQACLDPSASGSLNKQSGDQGGLQHEHARRPDDVELVLIPQRRLSKPDEATRRQSSFR